jgi:hypothetical protein
MIILFTAIALFYKRTSPTTSTSWGLAILTLVVFVFYIASLTGAPLGRLLDTVTLVYRSIKEIMQAGPSFLNELGAKATGGAIQWDEVSSFLASLPSALVLAIASVMVVRLVEDRMGDAQRKSKNRCDEKSFVRRDLRSLCLFGGVLLVLGYVGSYVAHYFVAVVPAWNRLPIEYVIPPLAPVALLVSTVTLTWILKNMNIARKLLLLGLLMSYAISVTASPAFLHENSPLAARLIPTQSEKAAASFLSAKLDSTSGTQVVTDWAFLPLVRGELYSEHLSIRVRIPTLMFAPMEAGKTMMLLRAYYIQNAYLKAQAPYEISLTDSEKWRTFNKIFDDSSTSIYSGTL